MKCSGAAPIVGGLFCIPLFCLSICVQAANDGYTQTRYPIVLAHGMAGFDNIAGLNYWYGIPHALRKGGAEVYNTQVSSFNASEIRGEQLLAQVEEILAVSGAEKVHLFGHSHGGHSIRYVAAMIPDRIASLTNIHSPVKGSPQGDQVATLRQLPYVGKMFEKGISGAINGFGRMVGRAAGEKLPQDSLAGLYSVTQQGALEVNRLFPNGVPVTAYGEGESMQDGIFYFSWSGVINSYWDFIDPFSYAMQLNKGQLDEPNDGLVGQCSSHFGKVIRDDYPLDHFDAVNHLLGRTPPFAADPRAIFRQQANRLKKLGL